MILPSGPLSFLKLERCHARCCGYLINKSTRRMKLEVVYINMQYLVGHSNREAKFNRHEMYVHLINYVPRIIFIDCHGLYVYLIDLDKVWNWRDEDACIKMPSTLLHTPSVPIYKEHMFCKMNFDKKNQQ
jgi:hypothetical protein